MPKDEGEASYWMLDEGLPEELDYDIAQEDRKLIRDLQYFDEMEDSFGTRYQDQLEEVTFEELKIRDQDQSFTVLRVYDSSGLLAADIYEEDGESPETTELEMMESESPEWISGDRAALSILDKYSHPDYENDSELEEEEAEEEDAYRKIVGEDAPDL